jgi:CBS domain-containing protein
MTTIGEIMHRDLVTVDPTVNVTQAAGAMFGGRAGSALVLDNGSLVGIFTERDILRAMSESPKADVARVSSVSKWMTRDPVTIGPDNGGEALIACCPAAPASPAMEGDSS